MIACLTTAVQISEEGRATDNTHTHTHCTMTMRTVREGFATETPEVDTVGLSLDCFLPTPP